MTNFKEQGDNLKGGEKPEESDEESQSINPANSVPQPNSVNEDFAPNVEREQPTTNSEIKHENQREEELKLARKVARSAHTAVESTSPSEIKDLLNKFNLDGQFNSLSNYFYFILELIDSGELSREAYALSNEIKGLLPTIVDLEEGFLDEDLEAAFDSLGKISLILSRQDEIISYDESLLARAIAVIEKLIDEASSDCSAISSVEKKDRVKTKYLDPSIRFQRELKRKQSELNDLREIKEKKEQIRALRLWLNEETPRDRSAYSTLNFVEQRRKLEDLKNEIKERYEQIEETIIDSGGVDDEINSLMGSLTKQYEDAISRMDDLIRETIEPPVQEMTKQEIVDRVIERRLYPFTWSETSFEEGRNRDLIEEAWRICTIPESDQDEELERLTQKARLTLYWAHVKLTAIEGEATVKREKVIGWLQSDAGITRSEMLAGTTMHPEYGPQIKEMFDYVRLTAATPPGFVVIERLWVPQSGRKTLVSRGLVNRPLNANLETGLVLINESELTNQDVVVARHDPELTYDILASTSGSAAIERHLKEKFDYSDLAAFFTSKIFIVSDEITSTLALLKRRTKTGTHTNDTRTDYGSLLDPLGAIEHAAERYSNEDNWLGSLLLFMETIPITDTIGKSLSADERAAAEQALEKFRGRALTTDEKDDWINTIVVAERDGFFQSSDAFVKTRFYPSQFLREKQEELRKYYECYFEVDDIIGRIPSLDYGTGWFKPLSSVFFPKDGEADRPSQIQDFRDYEVALSGWKKIMEMIMSGYPPRLTNEQIFVQYEESGDTGLINAWFKEWGKTKIWEAPFLSDGLAPLTLMFIFKIAQSYKGRGRQAVEYLWREIVSAIGGVKSGGLSSYSEQLNNVLDVIGRTKPSANFINHYDRNRTQQRKEYLETWYMEETGGRQPPPILPGTRFSLKPGLAGISPQEQAYLDSLKGRRKLPAPVANHGNFIKQKDED